MVLTTDGAPVMYSVREKWFSWAVSFTKRLFVANYLIKIDNVMSTNFFRAKDLNFCQFQALLQGLYDDVPYHTDVWQSQHAVLKNLVQASWRNDAVLEK